MTQTVSRQLAVFLLRYASLVLFGVIILVFAGLSDRFFDPRNFLNIVIQAAHVGILGIGMTFVLLTAGIDLSVGAVMYVSAALLGVHMVGLPLWLSFPVVCLIGIGFGAVNGFLVTQLRVAAFIATLSTLFIGRGLALYVTSTQMIIMQPATLDFGRMNWIGVPISVWIFLVVLATAWVVLTQTTFGRQIYAVGADPEGAAKAGINVKRILFAVYVICGLCAAIAGLVSASQVGTVSPTFAIQKEFAAIAAAVLGGTSLFGGRGSVLGTVFGAILIQTVMNGLVIINADPYIYPVVIATTIFIAVLVDSLRTHFLDRIGRRTIRLEEAS
jgi:ribose transport system permease protein